VDWQLAAVGLIVAGAVGYLARSAWKTWAGGKTGCGSGCGKCEKPADAGSEQTKRIPLL
jgi:hypothetical protein